MQVYVVRHGQTNWNVKKITQGWSQNRLNEVGKEQARETAQKLEKVKVDLIFSSPLMRAMQTTNILNQNHNAKIIRDKRLIEDNKGLFTGKKDKEITREQWDLYNKSPSACGVESLFELYTRICEFKKFLKENYADKKVLIVTHSNPAKMFQYCSLYDVFDEKTFKELKNFKNAECRVIEI